MAAALRQVNDMSKLKEDFIIMQGDIVTNALLKDAVQMHMASKKKDKSGEGASVVLTKIFAPIPFTNPVRDPSQEVALLLDEETR